MAALPHFVVINLDRDSDRLAHMQREFDKAGLSFQRFTALKGSDLPVDLRSFFPDASAGAEAALSAGEIGCYASHLAICKQMLEGALPTPLCVMEDDIELAPGFKDLMTDLLGKLPPDWDFVRLSNDAKNVVMPVAPLAAPYQLVRYSKVPGSTGASLISRTGAEKFLAAAARTLPIDQDLKRVWVWKLNMFGVVPAPVRRDIFDVSSIDAMTDAGFRTKSWRIARLRRSRATETFARHAHGVREFGLTRWLAAEFTNIRATLTPKQQRAALLAHASQRLAQR
ncbi:MAG: glycosyltransferase family 25 protein [Hyphomonadaceae bacterium]|nr:glycosyltransferase family 25 protein [Hyphomonadaceae bacterium]